MNSTLAGPTSNSPENQTQMHYSILAHTKPQPKGKINKQINIGQSIYRPVVSRFFCPPEIPLSISSPTNVSAHMSKPKIFVRYILVLQKCF